MRIRDRQNNRKKVNELIFQSTNNAIKCSGGIAENLPHRITKFWIANFCWDNGLSFSTEVTFKSGGRADFVVKDWCLIIEVLNTEDVKSFLKKKYPLRVIPVKASINPVDLKVMMEDLAVIDGDDNGYYFKNNLPKIL